MANAPIYNEADDAQRPEVKEAKLLFVAIIEKAIFDVKDDPLGKEVLGAQAYEWFWSHSFRWWCDLCGWDSSDYKFVELRRKIATIREEAKEHENI